MVQPGIRVAPDLFAPPPGVAFPDSTDESILVESAEPVRAAHALARAAASFMLVAEDGRVFTSSDQMDENYLSPQSLYTPNYVSPVYRSGHGPWVYIDAKGFIVPPMGETFVRLVTDELISAGIQNAVLRALPETEYGKDWEVWIELQEPRFEH